MPYLQQSLGLVQQQETTNQFPAALQSTRKDLASDLVRGAREQLLSHRATTSSRTTNGPTVYKLRTFFTTTKTTPTKTTPSHTTPTQTSPRLDFLSSILSRYRPLP